MMQILFIYLHLASAQSSDSLNIKLSWNILVNRLASDMILSANFTEV